MLSDHIGEFEGLRNDTERRLSTFELHDATRIIDEAGLIAAQIREMRSCLRSIETSLCGLPAMERSSRLAELEKLKRDLVELNKDWLRTLSANQERLPHETHRRAVVATEKMERGTRQLKETSKVLFETEEIGQDVLTELHKQREVMEKTKANTQESAANLEEADSTLGRMTRWWSDLF